MSSQSKSVKKIVEEARDKEYTEVDLADRGIANLADVPFLTQLKAVTTLILSHNRLTSVPDSISELKSLEMLNLFNNEISELPTTLCNLPKLKFLNLALNNLKNLPKGFGACPQLEVLDLTYNNLTQASWSGNFFYLDPLRALYLGDNEFEKIPPEIKNFKNLQILVLRDNDLVEIPREIGELSRLKELHIQNNRLQCLPPELGEIDLESPKRILRADNNPWMQEIADQIVLGVSHVLSYLRTDEYKRKYQIFMATNKIPPPRKEREKSLKKKKEGKTK